MTASRWSASPTPAQARFLEEVLGWGHARPEVPAGLLQELDAELRAAVRARWPQAERQPRSAPLPSSRHLLGLLRDDGPGTAHWHHDRSTVRGVLLGRSFARDVEQRHRATPAAVVAEVTAELAGERPFDPASASAWCNAAQPSVRTELHHELTAALADLRTLWPVLDPAHVAVEVRPTRRVEVAPGPQVVTVRPDVVLASHRQDERARSLTLVTRAGMPRPREDLTRVRATALLTALATGRVPFRWAVLHLTDGRAEVEDLDVAVLASTARWLGERIGAQMAEGPGSTQEATDR